VNNAAVIRPVAEADLGSVVAMVHELAEYERAPDQCHLTVEQLRTALFGDRPALFGHVAELPGGELVGTALWFLNFSTWDGVHGVYVEDMYVRPALRGRGVGRRLYRHLAQLALDRGYSRVECVTLLSNSLGMSVHRSLGARAMDDWRVLRWEGAALRALAHQGTIDAPSRAIGS
jgi:GNAT superfamily N-acetyltransferase